MAKKKPQYAKVGQQVAVQVPVLEDSVYLNPHLQGDVNPVLIEKHDLYELDRIEYPGEGGIHLWLQGLKYPVKGLPNPISVGANNRAKRVLINQLKIWAKYPISAYYLLTRKGRNFWLREYINMVYPILEGAFFDPIKYNSLSRELFKIVPIFLKEMKVDDDLAYMMGHIAAALLEHDDAYRYRAEDLFSCTSKEALLQNPVKELKLILKILGQRDKRPQIHQKFGAIGKLLQLGFWFPGIKKAFKKAIEASTFENMQLDEIDTYHTLRYSTYDFRGISFEQRFAEFLKIHDGVEPKSIPMNR